METGHFPHVGQNYANQGGPFQVPRIRRNVMLNPRQPNNLLCVAVRAFNLPCELSNYTRYCKPMSG